MPGAEHELLELNASVFHNNDSSSQVFVEINNNNLIYKRSESGEGFEAEVKVSYSLCVGDDCRRTIDTGTFYMFDPEVKEPVPLKTLSYRFSVRARFGNNYTLKFESIDLNRKTLNALVIPVNKTDRFNGQNFLIESGGSPMCKSYCLQSQQLKISANQKPLNRLYVSYFSSDMKPALPPFSSKETLFPSKPDSSFVLDAESGYFFITAPDHGFYFLKADPEINIGFCLFTCRIGSFPSISSSSDMIQSCRYMMFKEEFDSCLHAPDKKQAIDNFWLNIGGSHERAREILKKYYQRVKIANEQFSSFMEGWKTDRGMVSIIFGEPTNVYKSIKDEIWVYGSENNPSTLRFMFKKRTCPYSDNDFVLDRSDFFKDVYYQAVDYWRQGIVYSEKNVEH